MHSPFVSVIVPCYNQALYLSETLDSILKQTFPDWECIIVNDGSTDKSEEIARGYCLKDQRFQYHYKNNGGIASSRNFGIKQSKGQFILPLDGDDLINPNYIELALEVFEKNPKVKLVYSKAQMFGIVNREWVLPEYSYSNLLYGNMIFCSAIYRRTDFDKTKGYNENMVKGLEDWDFWIGFLDDEDVVYKIPHICFYYRVKEASRTTAIDKTIAFELREQIYSNHKDKYERYIPNLIWDNYLFKDLEAYASDLESQINSLKASKAYKYGKLLLSPLSKLKRNCR